MTLEQYARVQQGVVALPPGQAVVRWLGCAAVPAARLAAWRAMLDAEEQARAERFHFARDRDAFIAAHALARAMLARHGGRAAAAWRFVAGPFGKPAIDPALGCQDLHFNLSHTHGMVACGVARTPIGVDVEPLARGRCGRAIAERYFTHAEAALLAAEPDASRQALFVRLWTLKEAVMKATGQGFSLPLDAFCVAFAPLRVAFHDRATELPGGWSLVQQPAGPAHLLAVALRTPAAAFDIAGLD